MELCLPHLDRGMSVFADKTVAGTPMCNACFSGEPIRSIELAGDIRGDERSRLASRRFYEANREETLATHRRWREAKREKSLCPAT